MTDGYEIVADKVREYWHEVYLMPIDVAVAIECDGMIDEVVASPVSSENFEEVEFSYDFWEGEEDVKVRKIAPLWDLLYQWRLGEIKVSQEVEYDKL